jgi:hypothetical protein
MQNDIEHGKPEKYAAAMNTPRKSIGFVLVEMRYANLLRVSLNNTLLG